MCQLKDNEKIKVPLSDESEDIAKRGRTDSFNKHLDPIHSHKYSDPFLVNNNNFDPSLQSKNAGDEPTIRLGIALLPALVYTYTSSYNYLIRQYIIKRIID